MAESRNQVLTAKHSINKRVEWPGIMTPRLEASDLLIEAAGGAWDVSTLSKV
jgi:hypothetical protein